KAQGHAETSYDVAPTEEAGSDRETSRLESSGMLGATGLLRTLSAASGAPGTFRFSLLTGFYSGSGFLCPQCPNNGQNADLQDKTSRVSGNLYLSASITDYLEAYAGVFSHSTSTDRPVDQLKQVVGDWDLGVKAFMPAERDQVFTWGGALDLGFSTGSGKVGLSGIDAVNLGVRALGTADFSKQSKDPLPVRANVNLSYFFDNSGKLVQDFEKSQGRNIDRIERFSLDINRVDFIQFGMGAEGLFDGARPFLEWSIDIPANRQGYVCDRNTVPSGDSCLRDRARFSTTPSRLSAGVRAMPWKAFPWWLEGLTLTGALEVATGGASDFLVEVAPEVPWTVWFGLGYAGDTKPKVQIQQVPSPIPPPPPVLSVHGRVVEKQTATAVAGALIHFEGRELTGLISTNDGRFVSGPLDPGQYTFRITAPGYKEGKCSVAVSEVALPVTVPPFAPGPLGETASARAEIASPAPALSSDAPPGPARTGPRSPATNESGTPAAPAENQPGVSNVTCELEPVPKVSNLNGRVSDVNTGEPIGGASVKITDVLGRQLELQVDEVGAFRFENVPPGAAVISIQAPGYLRSVIRMNI
ncbi:MAG TPA: carboxypeptidase regulatory-like domain-containing protein, partial [Polyangiaceae bacterium]|nr:carboxypeptidase regulatory-like domain-containing protein [Polyangiaceae bacterium]